MTFFPRVSVFILLAALTGVVRAAPTWEEGTGAQAAAAGALARPRRRHRPRGGSESRRLDDEIQREALELMKTVRPAAEWRKGEPIGRFLDTYYFNVLETDYPGEQTVPVKDRQGNVLAQVTAGFWEHFSVEGTGRLRDGRELNTSESGFIFTDAPMGEGTCRLKAWRTMAVDPRVIPLGTVVRIDETIGLLLPDGSVSDGYWRAEDTGGEVRNAHVDLYVGDGEAGGGVLERAGIHLKGLTVRYVETPPATCAKP